VTDKPQKLDSFITDLSVLKLSPDETLIVKVPDELMNEVDTIVMMRQAIASMVGTQRVMVVSANIVFEVIKTEVLLGETPCEHCGGSKRDEAGADCQWCQPWVPRKFA
jgi:hypothetical protein